MKISYKILIPLIAFFVLLIAGMSIFVKNAITDILITEEFIRITENTERDIQKLLKPEDFTDPLSPASQERFRNFFRSINSSFIAHARIWDTDYRIIFSDLRKHIGFRNPAHTDIQKLFAEEESFFISKEEDINEPIDEGSEVFSDVYIPIKFAGKTIGAAEIHFIGASVLEEISKKINFIIIIITAGALLLFSIIWGAIRWIILQPIARLQNKTNAINERNFTQPIGLFANDEIGALARSFDSMRIHIKSLLENISKERDTSNAIISSMSEGLFIVDKEYTVISMNYAASAFLEITPQEAIGQNIKTLIKIYKQTEELAFDKWPISQVFATGAPAIRSLEDNVFFQLRSGRKMPVVIFASPLRDDGIIGAVIVFRDITDEYKLNEAKNEFVSVASHQLRTPLTAVRWYSEMLLAGDAGALTDNQKEFVGQVYAGAGHLIDIINVLLSLARIEGGRIKIDPVPINIPIFIKEIVEEFTPFIREKKLSIRIHAPARPLNLIYLDASLFRQVVINLLSNATRYASVEGVIEIGFVDQGDHAQVFVKDDGIGIPAEQKDRIFEKFFRADNAINQVPEGTGLGLNLAREIVRLWKGKIWFRSPAEWTRADGTKEMKGTSFHFIVPYKGMEARFTGKPLA